MDKLIEFLSNPHNTGLYILTYKLELSKIAEFIDRAYPRGSSVSDFIDTLLERDERSQKRLISDRLSTAFTHIIREECKSEICDYFNFKPEDVDSILEAPDTRRRIFSLRRLVRGFLRPRLYPEHLEFLYIDFKISNRKKNMVIELISLKKIGIKLFDDMISCLPILSDSFEEISRRKTHSEKYIFKTYSMGVQLWVDEEDRFLLNENIQNFINASIRYYDMKEWRTSIVLSSITVESIFAELYEEAYKKNAPDIPLGGLIHEVGKIINIPSDLNKKINELNKARIASVHRSENPVSDKDAIISMMGATSLTMWYFSNY